MSGRQHRRPRLSRRELRLATLVAAFALAAALHQLAAAASLADGLATDDPRALAAAISSIEHAAPPDPDALFAAGRACEDKLADPVHALAIYERIEHDLPDASVATAATRRATALRDLIGPAGAQQATEYAHLIADADHLPIDDVIRRADALAAAPWPGAPISALWLADVLRRAGRFDDAQAHYARVIASWPTSPQAPLAARGAAASAIDAHEWTRAATLVDQLPTIDPIDGAVHDELVAAIARGRLRAHLYLAAWITVALAFALLAASLLDAVLRGGTRWPSPRPPLELWFLAPIALVFVLVSFTAHHAIAPAVMWISIAGVALAWLSGTTLDLLRARNRPLRIRSLAHVLACLLGVVSIAYIALTRDGLLDLLAETVRFGPGS